MPEAPLVLCVPVAEVFGRDTDLWWPDVDAPLVALRRDDPDRWPTRELLPVLVL